MTDPRQQEKAALYVLGLLENVERAAVELELATDAELRALVAEMREGLAEASLADVAPVAPSEAVWNSIAGRVASEPQITPAPVSSLPASPRGAMASWAWPVAAAILLSLNIWQLATRRPAVVAETAAYPAAVESVAAQPPVADEAVAAADPSDAGILMNQLVRLRQTNEVLERQIELQNSILAEREEELRAITGGEDMAPSERRRFFEEYQRLAARLMPYFEPVDGLSRFTVIELVDSNTYASEGPRRGFTDIAERLLEDLNNTGNIASAKPVIDIPTVEPARLGDGAAGPALISGGESPMVPGFATAASPEPEPTASAQPAAFTVWRDDDQKGFLDIYNLPEAPEGAGYQLWVRASELEPYIAVGSLPDDSDGYLSLFYEVDVPNFSPTEVLITLETGQPAEQPTGTVVLRGP